MVNFRLTASEYSEMETAASSAGFASLSDYIRHLHRSACPPEESDAIKEQPYLYDVLEPKIYEKTKFGHIYLGDSLGLLHKTPRARVCRSGSLHPHRSAFVRKKAYGNEDADQYVEWFRPFAEGIVMF